MCAKSISILLCLLSVAHTNAQEWRSDLSTYFDCVRKETFPAVPKSLLSTNAAPEILLFLTPLVGDTSYSVRSKAIELIYAVSSHAESPSIRGRGIELLLQPCMNGDTEAAGTALELVTRFDRTDFTDMAKESVTKLVRRNTLQYNEVMKLAAFLELRDLIPDIRIRSGPGNRAPIRWAALLSLARLGDTDAISDIMARVKKLPVTDDLVYKVFPDLAFTRNKQLIGYMVEVLMSDSKDCLGADAEREMNIPCGYRIMEQLAVIIEGFPLVLDDFGDVKTNDYPAALLQVREWFVNNTDYTIRNDRY